MLYGDGSRLAVLETAGISRPKAVVVMYSSKDRSVAAVERMRHAFSGVGSSAPLPPPSPPSLLTLTFSSDGVQVPIYARARDLGHLLALKLAGATDVVLENAEASLRLGSVLLQDLGVMRDDVVFLRRVMREAMDQRAQEAFINRDGEPPQKLGTFRVPPPPPLPLPLFTDSSLFYLVCRRRYRVFSKGGTPMAWRGMTLMMTPWAPQ